jgi:hypothetical protein
MCVCIVIDYGDRHLQYFSCTLLTTSTVSMHSGLGVNIGSMGSGASPSNTFIQANADTAMEFKSYPPSNAMTSLPCAILFNICVICPYPAGVTLHLPMGSLIAASKPAETGGDLSNGISKKS